MTNSSEILIYRVLITVFFKFSDIFAIHFAFLAPWRENLNIEIKQISSRQGAKGAKIRFLRNLKNKVFTTVFFKFLTFCLWFKSKKLLFSIISNFKFKI